MKNILIISGPTGSGESTVTDLLRQKYPIFKRLVTATSRRPRLHEKNGRDYFFFTKKQFKQNIANGQILEFTYIKNRNTYYGTYLPDLKKKLKAGYNVIANTDYIGTEFYKKNYGAIGIFIKPESLAAIKKRLLARQPNLAADELKKRLANAQAEIKREEKYYSYTVFNRQNRLPETIGAITKILKKEGYRLKK
ncbi:MAG: guanylate kinase [Candidatus Komeilibacteria bacterium]|nr:guanylate kinase [Candidatus Komeilibacteria bacterium]